MCELLIMPLWRHFMFFCNILSNTFIFWGLYFGNWKLQPFLQALNFCESGSFTVIVNLKFKLSQVYLIWWILSLANLAKLRGLHRGLQYCMTSLDPWNLIMSFPSYYFQFITRQLFHYLLFDYTALLYIMLGLRQCPNMKLQFDHVFRHFTTE